MEAPVERVTNFQDVIRPQAQVERRRRRRVASIGQIAKVGRKSIALIATICCLKLSPVVAGGSSDAQLGRPAARPPQLPPSPPPQNLSTETLDRIFARKTQILRSHRATAARQSDESQAARGGGDARQVAGGEAPGELAASVREKRRNKLKSLDDFLDGLPISSVGQRHSASFECDVGAAQTKERPQKFRHKLVWLKLVRKADRANETKWPSGDSDEAAAAPPEGGGPNSNDVTLLSLNERLITPDKRYKVSHQPPAKWTLSIDNVGQLDDRAFYLCQSSSPSSPAGAESDAAGSQFVGGAKLNVLVPPKIVESDTSPSFVSANEFEPLRLQCKVSGESQAQISWRREDGRSLNGAEQRFRHQLERRPNQLLSVDSAELAFDQIRRDQAGAYLCIASNGVLPGVSQRVGVQVERCRTGAELQLVEPCGEQVVSGAPEAPATTAATRGAQTSSSAPQRRAWKTQTEQRNGRHQLARQRPQNRHQPQQNLGDRPRNSNDGDDKRPAAESGGGATSAGAASTWRRNNLVAQTLFSCAAIVILAANDFALERAQGKRN